jgi:hypothetical protein
MTRKKPLQVFYDVLKTGTSAVFDSAMGSTESKCSGVL